MKNIGTSAAHFAYSAKPAPGASTSGDSSQRSGSVCSQMRARKDRTSSSLPCCTVELPHIAITRGCKRMPTRSLRIASASLEKS